MGEMVKKRRNRGRAKHNRGHVNRVHCETTGRMVPKDKAVRRFVIRPVIEHYTLPKTYRKQYYCISSAIRERVVRIRSRKWRSCKRPSRKIDNLTKKELREQRL